MLNIRRDVIVNVEPTPKELADCFCNMYAEDQALFFNHIAVLVEKWGSSFCFQLQAVISSKILTSGGKEAMRQIGEYGGD